MNNDSLLSHDYFMSFALLHGEFIGVAPLLSMRREDISLRNMTVAFASER
jgi:hypothetical protein